MHRDALSLDHANICIHDITWEYEKGADANYNMESRRSAKKCTVREFYFYRGMIFLSAAGRFRIGNFKYEQLQHA